MFIVEKSIVTTTLHGFTEHKGNLVLSMRGVTGVGRPTKPLKNFKCPSRHPGVLETDESIVWLVGGFQRRFLWWSSSKSNQVVVLQSRDTRRTNDSLIRKDRSASQSLNIWSTIMKKERFGLWEIFMLNITPKLLSSQSLLTNSVVRSTMNFPKDRCLLSLDGILH